MGGNSSKSVTETTREVVNSSVTEIFTNSENVTKSEIIVKQNAVLNEVEALGCTLDVTQDSDVNVTVISQLTDQQVTSIQNELTNKLTTEAGSDASTESGFMATAIANSSSSRTEVTEKIKNEIKNKLDSTVLNEVISEISSDQTLNFSNITLDPCGLRMYKIPEGASSEIIKAMQEASDNAKRNCNDGKLPSCGNINQNSAIDAVAENITDKIMDMAFENNFLTESDISASSSASTTSGGIPSWIWIVLIGLFCLFIFVKFILPMLSSRKQQRPLNA